MQILCDPPGIALVLVTWVLFLFTHRTTVVYVFDSWFTSPTPTILPGIAYTAFGSVGFILFRGLVALAVASHVRAVCCDAGSLRDAPAVPPPTVKGPRICKSCGGRWKPPRAHHCRKCKKCIFRMDHHCPWINNCVGLFNQKFFILFLIYTVASCGLNILLLLIGGVLWFTDKTSASIDLNSTLVLTCDVVVSAFFLFMAYDFLTEQVEALDSNSTLVESYQSTHGVKEGFFEHVQSVFGRDYLWYPFPFHPPIAINYEEPVLLDKTVAYHLKHKGLRKRRGAAGKAGSAQRPQLSVGWSGGGSLAGNDTDSMTLGMRQMMGTAQDQSSCVGGSMELTNFTSQLSESSGVGISNRESGEPERDHIASTEARYADGGADCCETAIMDNICGSRDVAAATDRRFLTRIANSSSSLGRRLRGAAPAGGDGELEYRHRSCGSNSSTRECFFQPDTSGSVRRRTACPGGAGCGPQTAVNGVTEAVVCRAVNSAETLARALKTKAFEGSRSSPCFFPNGSEATTERCVSAEGASSETRSLLYDDGSPCVVNMYVRPKHDIGVDMDDDDETHFVNLSESSSTEESDDDEFAVNDGGGAYGPSDENDTNLRHHRSAETRRQPRRGMVGALVEDRYSSDGPWMVDTAYVAHGRQRVADPMRDRKPIAARDVVRRPIVASPAPGEAPLLLDSSSAVSEYSSQSTETSSARAQHWDFCDRTEEVSGRHLHGDAIGAAGDSPCVAKLRHPRFHGVEMPPGDTGWEGQSGNLKYVGCHVENAGGNHFQWPPSEASRTRTSAAAGRAPRCSDGYGTESRRLVVAAAQNACAAPPLASVRKNGAACDHCGASNALNGVPTLLFGGDKEMSIRRNGSGSKDEGRVCRDEAERAVSIDSRRSHNDAGPKQELLD